MNLSGSQKLKKLCTNNKNVWMGIINLTPDSFSDGGKFNCIENAIKRAEELIYAGANILDFGAVSTKPYSETIIASKELERLYETLLKIKRMLPKEILISLDSFSPKVVNILANEGLIDIINDQYSSKIYENVFLENEDKNINLAQVAAFYDLGYVIMHMQGEPSNMQINPSYQNCSKEVIQFLKERIEFAENIGVKYIVIDPGIGFGKNLEHNLELLSENFMKNILLLNKPVLIGLSRKSFLGKIYPNLTKPNERDFVTKEFEFKCIEYGAKIIRTHVMPIELKN